MSYNENTAQMICSQQDGIGPINISDKDWYKKLLKIALCSDTPMANYECKAVHKKGSELTLETTGDSRYVAGQSVVLSGLENQELDGTYIILSSAIPNKFTIRVPEELKLPSYTLLVRLKTGDWTYNDVNENITDFFPRDYVHGEDYYIRLDNTPFINLNTNTQGRASEFKIMYEVEGVSVHVNSETPMALPTRSVPSRVLAKIPNEKIVASRYKTWSIFFNHESVYFFSGMKYGLQIISAYIVSDYYSGYIYDDFLINTDDSVRTSSDTPSRTNSYLYNPFYMPNLTSSDNNLNIYADPLVAFCFTSIKESQWQEDISLIERRIYSAPPKSLSEYDGSADSLPTNGVYTLFPNIKSPSLPVLSGSFTDVMLRIAKYSNTVALNSRVSLTYGGGGRSGSFPFHAQQAIGKKYYQIEYNGLPYGTLHGRISIVSDISRKLVLKTQPVSGDSVNYSLLGMPIERYEDDSVLIGICRGVGGSITFINNTTNTTNTGSAAWDAMLIGGLWDAS